MQAQKVNVDTATHVHGQTCEPSEDNNTREWQQKEKGQLLTSTNSLLDSLVVECWLRVREVLGSIPSQGPRHTKDVITMVPVAPLFSTQHSKGEILALSQELR